MIESADRRGIVRDALGIAVAAGAYGISFGVISRVSGLSLAQTCVLSLLMFTGASQFAFVGVIAAGGAPYSAVGTALVLGARNGLYGLRLATTLQPRGLRRLLLAHLVIDETTAMTIRREDPDEARYAFWSTALALYVTWNVGTLIGALAGPVIGDPRQLGLDAAVPAAFLALMWPQLESRPARLTAGGAVVVTLLLVPAVPAGLPVLVAGTVAIAVGWLTRPEAAAPGEVR